MCNEYQINEITLKVIFLFIALEIKPYTAPLQYAICRAFLVDQYGLNQAIIILAYKMSVEVNPPSYITVRKLHNHLSVKHVLTLTDDYK